MVKKRTTPSEEEERGRGCTGKQPATAICAVETTNESSAALSLATAVSAEQRATPASPEGTKEMPVAAAAAAAALLPAPAAVRRRSFAVVAAAFALVVVLRTATAVAASPRCLAFAPSVGPGGMGWRSGRRSGRRRRRAAISSATTTTASSTALGGAATLPEIGTTSRGGDVTFLGMNEMASVRLGCVLLAPKDEYHHLLRQSAVLVYAMGEREEGGKKKKKNGEEDGEEDEDTTVYVVRGLILDHPTPFNLKEMLPPDQLPSSSGGEDNRPLLDATVFRGGDSGGEGVLLLHRRPDLEGSVEVGEGSGLYVGGWDAAMRERSPPVGGSSDGDKGGSDSDSDQYKVFFNYCEFTEAEIEDMLRSDGYARGEGGNGAPPDGWMSVQVDPRLVLNSDYGRGDAWARFRNAVSQMRTTSTSGGGGEEEEEDPAPKD